MIRNRSEMQSTISNLSMWLLLALGLLAAACSSDQSSDPTVGAQEPIATASASVQEDDDSAVSQPPATPDADTTTPTLAEPTPAALPEVPASLDEPERYEQIDGRYVAPRLAVVVFDLGVDPKAAAIEIADVFDGEIVGLNDRLGFAEIEFVDDPDPMLEDLLERINAHPGVTTAELSSIAPPQTSQAPLDWEDEYWSDKDPSWPIEMTGVTELWDQGRRSAPDVGVLVVDFGIWDDHPDLKFAEPVITRFADNPQSRLDQQEYGAHGTAVAGVACGSADGAGIVGVAQGCELFGLDLVSNEEPGAPTQQRSTTLIDEALVARPSIRIVNMSWTNGPHPDNNCEEETTPATVQVFSRLFRAHPDVLWVAAAGNCPIEVPVLETDLAGLCGVGMVDRRSRRCSRRFRRGQRLRGVR